MATSTTGSPGSWTDQGLVISSSSSNNFNVSLLFIFPRCTEFSSRLSIPSEMGCSFPLFFSSGTAYLSMEAFGTCPWVASGRVSKACRALLSLKSTRSNLFVESARPQAKRQRQPSLLWLNAAEPMPLKRASFTSTVVTTTCSPAGMPVVKASTVPIISGLDEALGNAPLYYRLTLIVLQLLEWLCRSIGSFSSQRRWDFGS